MPNASGGATHILDVTSIASAPLGATVTEVPTHAAPLRPPVSRSQYTPGGTVVATVVASAVVPRLIATKPLSPRENAIALMPSSHQSTTSVPATVRRKRTIPRM